MITLPSGRKAGITNIRARYHALRLNRAITADTPRQDLYRLIDIVVPPKDHQYLPGSSSYVFTGHTLDELQSINQWPLEDRKAFEGWIEQASQVGEIEQVRRRIPDDFPLAAWEFNHTDKLYSGLKRRIKSLSMKQASPDQWKKTLLNFKRDGLRAEELEWSGLPAFLDRSHREGIGRITRDALLQKIDFSLIQPCLNHELHVESQGYLEFVELPQSKWQNRLGSIEKINQAGEVCVLRYADTLHFYKVGHLMRVNTKLKWERTQRWFALDTIGNLISSPQTGESFFENQQAAFAAASEHALQHVGVPASYSHCNRYEHKTLCGGSEYREWLMTLPNYPISYHNKHYYERNLLLHFRTKERCDLSGRRLLFIEELQSDWHQSGAMHGYQTHWPGHIPPAPFRKEWVGLALKTLLIHAATEGYDGLAWTKGDVQEAHYKQTFGAVRRLYDVEIPKYLAKLCGDWGGRIESTKIVTKEPRLHISRQMDKWFVTDPNGSFSTRARSSQQEAIQIMARHSKKIDLDVPLLPLDQGLRESILENGFPLFGERQIKR
jgi:hypothetical protein